MQATDEIDFAVQADGTSTWVSQGYTRPKADGSYTRRQAQNRSSTWKAVQW
ncbi:hypothetical protein [Actinoplanes couchii]|uniref:Uncharacterized protein n=1 Tax=Actinoplanes couchii TaxID=403638 RepID=A0ABQ3XM22_9ACTN|nr:hypothetical protein [Actinoplanes couchii]MDR6319225.1 hypothetical protein [Actinoplanes couchii]GID59564.1 hypothetical protein Aco03nite_079680 [Actinoplanes couchii]